MTRGDRLQRRPGLATARLGYRTSRREATARRHRGQIGRLAVDRRQRLAAAAQRGQTAQQPDRVRVTRLIEDVARLAHLDDAPGIHDGDPVAELGHDPQIVRDEDQRQVGLALDLLQEPQVLRLDRHVQRRRRLVGDQETRLARDRDRAGDALADAATHLMGIGVHAPLGIADPHLP